MKHLTILALTLVLTGCGTTYEFQRDSGNVQVQEAIKEFTGEQATLELRDRVPFDGVITRVAGDTLEFQWDDLDIPLNVTLDQVRSITLDSKPFAPTGVGILVGATAGGFIGGKSVPYEPRQGPEALGPNMNHALAIGLGVVLGGIVGGALGHVLTRSSAITFVPDEGAGGGTPHPESVAIFGQKVTSDGDYTHLIVSDKEVRLPKSDTVIENVSNGVVVHVPSRSLMFHSSLLLPE